MKLFFMFLFIFISVPSCSTITKDADQAPRIVNLESTYDHALRTSSANGRKILQNSRSIIENKEVIVGGCWDFINAVYQRSGFGERERETVYRSINTGPFYVELDAIEPGDWLYFVNHTYNESDHSAIFVGWTDRDKLEALMVNYIGEKKKKPAFFKKFMLDKVYNVIRPR